MSGCGCGGGAGLLKGQDGILVTGNNTKGDPTVIGAVKDPVLCENVQDAAGDALCAGSGIVYDDVRGCLGVKVSPADGNDIGFGSDGGLWLGKPSSAVDQRCGNTVDQLPAFVCCGYAGLGRNAGPVGDRKAYWQAVNSHADAIWVGCQVSCDGAPFMSPLSDLNSGLLDPNPQTTTRNATAGQVLSLRWRWPAYTGAPGTEECPALLSLCDYLDIAVGHTVTFLYVQGATAAEDAEIIRRIARHCAARSVVAVVRDTAELPRLAAYLAAGIDTGVLVSDTGTPTPAQVSGAGARWVFAPNAAPNTVIGAYAAAGHQVLTYGSARRVDVDRGVSLGARGTLAWDVPYQCRKLAPLRDAPWCYDGVPSGQITDRDGRAEFLGWQGGRDRRGAAENVQACGWRFSLNSAAQQQTRKAITLGNMADASLAEYTVTWGLYFTDLAVSGVSQSQTGVIVCSRDDENPVPDPWTRVNPSLTGYSLMFQHRGQGLVIRRMPAETGAPLAQSAGSGNAARGVDYHFRARISGNRIDFVRLASRGGAPVGAPMVTTEDIAYRGPYLHMYLVQRFAGEAWTPIDATFTYLRIREGI
jgi:hypothetical protein